MRNSKWHPKGDTQDDTQDVTQGVTQEDTLDEKIEKAIKDNLNVTTEELAKQFGVTSMTIKRHLAKMPHIRYVGSGYSGHWEVLDKEYKPPSRFATIKKMQLVKSGTLSHIFICSIQDTFSNSTTDGATAIDTKMNTMK